MMFAFLVKAFSKSPNIARLQVSYVEVFELDEVGSPFKCEDMQPSLISLYKDGVCSLLRPERQSVSFVLSRED